METSISESITKLDSHLMQLIVGFAIYKMVCIIADEKEGGSILKMRTQLQYLSLLETVICKQCRICR